MIELSKDKIIERFRSYVALDTVSDDKSETSPSTAKQLKLAKLLKSELSGLGLDDVALTEYGYVLAGGWSVKYGVCFAQGEGCEGGNRFG